MGDEEKLDRSGPYEFDAAVDHDQAQPEGPSNPSGLGGKSCEEQAEESEGAACDTELAAPVEDMGLEESMPGSGIWGFEGEEVGGG